MIAVITDLVSRETQNWWNGVVRWCETSGCCLSLLYMSLIEQSWIRSPFIIGLSYTHHCLPFVSVHFHGIITLGDTKETERSVFQVHTIPPPQYIQPPPTPQCTQPPTITQCIQPPTPQCTQPTPQYLNIPNLFLNFCLFVLSRKSYFFNYLATVTTTGDRAANVDLCLALTAFSSEGSFTCHTYCYTGPLF
jgi:hypothetical protein